MHVVHSPLVHSSTHDLVARAVHVSSMYAVLVIVPVDAPPMRAVGAGGGVGVQPAYGVSGSMHAVRLAPRAVSQLRTVHVASRGHASWYYT